MNVGSAPNIFSALRESLQQHGLDFSKAVAFMSDTASVMNGLSIRCAETHQKINSLAL